MLTKGSTGSFDTAELYSIVGYLEAADGTLTFFYNASPWTHGQNTAASHDPTQPGGVVWGSNHGKIAVLSLVSFCPSR